MKKYQIIPRRFRPKRFSEVVGHEATITTLKNALTMGHIAQAYLFCGSRGTGKTTLARLFAKALNCTGRGDDSEPCNQCPSCQSIQAGRSLDLIEIDGASHRGVDDIRQINETVGYSSAQGGKKIYIIDEVHMLTKEAFNALLKTLEEPPQGVVFFFATTEPHKVLPTILSRCQRFDLQRLPLKAIITKLTSICLALDLSYEEELLELVAKLGDGSLRDAENLLDKLICSGLLSLTIESARPILGLLPSAFFSSLDEAIATSNLPQALNLGSELFERGADLATVLGSLLEHFRNHLVLLLDGFLSHYEKTLYQKQNAYYSQEQCLYLLDLLIQWQQHANSAFSSRAHFEILMTQLVRSKQTTTIDQLVFSLQELEKKLESSAPLPAASSQKREKEAEPIPMLEQKKEAQVESFEKKPPSSRPETLMRFAAVELEGTVYKSHK